MTRPRGPAIPAPLPDENFILTAVRSASEITYLHAKGGSPTWRLRHEGAITTETAPTGSTRAESLKFLAGSYDGTGTLTTHAGQPSHEFIIMACVFGRCIRAAPGAELELSKLLREAVSTNKFTAGLTDESLALLREHFVNVADAIEREGVFTIDWDTPLAEMRRSVPDDYSVVMASIPYFCVRETIARPEKFQRLKGIPWPTAFFDGGRGQVQLRPDTVDINPLMPPEEIETWSEKMFQQRDKLSDYDADTLDCLCVFYLRDATGPHDRVVTSIDDFLVARGLKSKRSGQGRRGGFEPEQRQAQRNSLARVFYISYTMTEIDVIEQTGKSRKGKRTTVRGMQSRPFHITGTAGQINLFDGHLEVDTFAFGPGDVFGHFITGPGRQVTLQSAKAIQYDPYRKRREKRLARYLSYHWKVVARGGNFVQDYRVKTLLERMGEDLNERRPVRTRNRFEQTLNNLENDSIIGAWEYAQWDESTAERRGWGPAWTLALVVIEAPEPIKDWLGSLCTGTAIAAPPDTKCLGQRLRQERKKLGFTQLQAAEAIGIPRNSLSRIESGKSKPYKDTRKKIETWFVSSPV